MKRTLILVLLLAAAAARGQQKQTDERDTVYYMRPVIITPTQARERETPVTFTNLTRRQIAEHYSVQDIPVLLSELPSITTYSESGSGIGYNYINLRGFDQKRLSVMVNGVPQNDPEDHDVYWLDFPDLMASTENVQVQRGSGSAFYGPPAIGGSVNLVTNPFTRKPGVTVEAMAGFQEFGDSSRPLALATKKYAVSVNSGLVDERYMFYGRLGRIQSDGYRESSWADYTSFFLGAMRFDGTMTTRFHIFGGPVSDALSYYGLPKFVNADRKLRRYNPSESFYAVDSTGNAFSYFAHRRPQETESFSQPHYELLHEWKLSAGVTLNTTLFYYTGDGYFDFDASWVDSATQKRMGIGLGVPLLADPANGLIRAFVGNRQWGLLPRAEIAHTNGTLTVGLEMRFHRSTHWGKIQFAEALPPGYDPDYHFYEYNGVRDILSAFAHEIYHIGERTTVMADLQLVRNRYAIQNEKYLAHDFDLSYLFANPRLGLNTNINDRENVYISLANTWREPRMRDLYAAEESYYGATPQFRSSLAGGERRYDFTSPLVHPEHLLDVEFGMGYNSDAARLTFNLFWMEFTDELIKTGLVDIFGQPVTMNAPRTRHIGVEFDGAVKLISGFELSGNFTFSKNLIQDLTVASLANAGGGTTDLHGHPIAGFPDLLGNARLTYRAGELTASVLAKYVGSFYTDNNETEANRNADFTVFNAELLYRVPIGEGVGLALRAEVRNVFDRLYFMSGEGDTFFPAAERNYLLGMTAEF
jgi:iron complex outermembrane receptor protein